MNEDAKAKIRREFEIVSFVAKLDKLARLADKLELKLSNGAFVDCLLGEIANDLRNQQRN